MRCPKTNKLYTSHHVTFFDSHFPYLSLLKTPEPPPWQLIGQPMHYTLPLSKSQPINPSIEPPAENSPYVPETVPSQSLDSSARNPSQPSSSLPTSKPKPPKASQNSTRNHNMTTRSQNNIFKPKKLYTATKHPLPENLEPSNVREAMRFSHWRKAMAKEFDALLRNGTWSLVPPTRNQNVVDCKWLFRIKWNLDGLIHKYKARLIAKGFT